MRTSFIVIASAFLLTAGAVPQSFAQRPAPAETKLTAHDGSADDNFGQSVAASETTIVVGALGDGDRGPFSGSAYIFERTRNDWREVAKLTASDGGPGEYFGLSVAASANVTVVGAANLMSSGKAYVFERAGGAWVESARLTALPGEPLDNFGYSVAATENIVVVGAPTDTHGGTQFGAGAAYVFERSGAEWQMVAKLTNEDADTTANFGLSVAAGPNTVIVGAAFDDARGPSSGSVYVFERSGGAWRQAAKLTANPGVPFEMFGGSVALSNSVLIAGAAGSAYVFERRRGAWQEVATLTPDSGANFSFGGSVAASADTLVVGAWDEGSAGASYVFRRSANGWREAVKLTASDGGAGDRFGWSVGAGPSAVVVGAPSDSDNGAESGSAYVFK